jgi:DNA invertase Pin-like site-specific DNA recombinase
MQDELRAIRSENVRRGMASARAEGRMKGRQPTISRPDVKAKVAQIGPEAAAVALGVSRTTVYRIMAAERRAA